MVNLQHQQQTAEPAVGSVPVSLSDLPATLHDFLGTTGGPHHHHHHQHGGSGNPHQMAQSDQDQVVNNNYHPHQFIGLTQGSTTLGSLGSPTPGGGRGGDPVLGSAKLGLFGLGNGVVTDTFYHPLRRVVGEQEEVTEDSEEVSVKVGTESFENFG